MTKITNKEIRGTVEEALKKGLSKYDVASSPKKADKIVKRFAKKMASAIKGSLKKKKAKTTAKKKEKVKKAKVVTA